MSENAAICAVVLGIMLALGSCGVAREWHQAVVELRQIDCAPVAKPEQKP